MKIKRYTGNDLQEAILKIKMDMGNDAIILSTKSIKQKGFLRFFSKPMVEVIAALDKRQDYKDALEKKVNNMEEVINKIYHQMKGATYYETFEEKTVFQQDYTDLMKIFYRNLLENDVEEKAAKEVIEWAREKTEGSDNVNDFISALYSYIIEILKPPSTIRVKKESEPLVIIFIGPTGAGKTTTLAKLAAHYSIKEGKDIALITADTYRIAAVDQLRIYADILGIPLSIIYSSNEIRNVIEGYSSKDLIMIDTAGRNHKNSKQIQELKDIINKAEADEVYLVLSMTAGKKNLKEVIDSYSFLDNYKLLFTKMDEAPSRGPIFNAVFYTKKVLSYIATGQNVPDDIEIADIDKIAKSLLGNSTGSK